MPAIRRKMADTNEFWHRWERFTKYGIRVNGKRYTSTQLFQVWALVLIALYILLRIHGSVPGGNAYRGSFEVDKAFWRDRHLIFCISPGRAGSKYLRNALGVAEAVVARHEPEPKMNGHFLKSVILEGKREESFEERAHVKLSAIRDALEGTESDVTYVETSHMFIKTFADVVIDKLPATTKISILNLRRPARDIVWSQLRLGWFSEGHSGKNVWYYNTNDVHPSENKIDYLANSSDPIETLIAYNADIIQRGLEVEREVKKRHKKREWRNVRMYEALLLDISGESAEDGVLKLISMLGLEADSEKLHLLKNMDRNARDVKKDRVKLKETIADVDEKIDYMKRKLPFLRQAMF